MKTIYQGDTRYEKIKEQMDLLSITDVTTARQAKNGTIVWRLPFKSRNRHIEYGSFTTGYVRNQGNQCHSNYQCNTRRAVERYYPDYEWVNGKQRKTGKYNKFITRACNLIPIEIDRLEYMMKYIIKNDFIKRASMLDTDFVPKWQYDNLRETVIKHGVDQYVSENVCGNEDLLCAMEAQTEGHNAKEITVIIDGHRYKVK